MSERQKIVFILPSLYHGGAERALITLMNKLDPGKFERILIILSSEGTLAPLIDEAVQQHLLNSRSFLKLLRTVKKINPDIIFTTMAYSNFLTLFLSFFVPRVRFIIREAVIPSSILNKHKRKAPFIRFLYRLLYPRADAVISPSRDIIDEFTAMGLNTQNHHILYNQIDEAEMRARLNDIAFPNAEDGALRLVCAGRLHPQKGYDRLIEALTNFTPDHPWHLLILGDGAEKETLQAQINALGLNNNITLYGAVSNPWHIIAAADALLLPSRWEGMPNVALEALSCGTPVIAHADANGVSEIQAQCEGGVLEIAQDMDAFIACIHALKPRNLNQATPSRLPDCFKSAVVMAQFEDILLNQRDRNL